MTSHFSKQFQAERTRRFDEVARKLLENQDVEAGKNYLEWVDTSAELLAPAQQASRRKWSLVVLAICVVLVGLAWTLRISFTHVALDVTTGNVMLTLSKEWTSDQQFTAEKVFIDHLAAIEAPGLTLPAGEQSGWIELIGKGIVLEKFTLAAGAEIELSVRKNQEVQLFVKRSDVTGTLQVQEAKLTMSNGENREIPPGIPETITFKTIPAGAAPIQLKLVTQENWRLRGLRTQALGFVEEYPAGTGNFVSVIQSGKITLRETELTKELHAAEYLTLQQPESQQLELANAENGIKVVFEGAAAKILTGSQDFKENLTPTWFEYLARQQRVSMFWGAVVFLSGLAWKIRETFLG